MLESLLRHKKEEKEYLVALVISENRIDAALWETYSDSRANVLKTATAAYIGEWEKAIDAADLAITEVESALPDGKELKKVVFGLFPEWLSDDHIKEGYLKKLKQLTSALSLTPVGFVELPTAVAHLLSHDEGAQQTVILVGFEKQHLTVSLFKIGKLIKSVTKERGSNSITDLEQLLENFADIEVLPSRLLLYGTTDDLPAIKNEMLSYPWQKKANFLHFPKIDLLSPDYAVKAVAVASASELTPHVESKEDANVGVVSEPTGDVSEVDTSAASMKTEAVADSKTESESENEVKSIAEDLGFVTDETAAVAENEDQPEVALSMDEQDEDVVENVTPVDIPSAKLSPKKKFNFSLPKFSFTLRFPRMLPKMGIIGGILGIGFLLFAATTSAFWWLPKAEVHVLVKPQIYDKTETISIDTGATAVDIEMKILPGSIQKTELSGSQTVSTSGKKIIGDKSRGEVTIYNKTLNTKSLKKGTMLQAGKLQFTLDADINIASASEGLGSLTYGTTKASVSAVAIGTASNLPASSEFTFEGLPPTSYTARNDAALSGGTSKEILVVTRDDQKEVREKAVSELKIKAADELSQKLTGKTKLLDNSLQTKILSEKFTKEIGEEATEITAEITVSIEGATYNEADFYTLLDTVIGNQIEEGYEYKPQNSKISFDENTVETDGVWVFKPHIQIKLLPKLATENFIKQLTNKTLNEASEFLKSQTKVAGVEYVVEAPLSFLKKKLPMNPNNITIIVDSL